MGYKPSQEQMMQASYAGQSAPNYEVEENASLDSKPPMNSDQSQPVYVMGQRGYKEYR